VSPDPRIPPLPPEEWEGDVKRILDTVPPGIDRRLGDNNIFPTFARHPDLFRAWLPFGGFLLTAGKLSGRDRELLILRTAVNCRSSYEWGQHVRISLDGGIEREAIDRTLDSRISDSTWEALAETYDTEQLMEATMVVGHYHMVAFALNSFGVELDDGLESLP
jgi:4-carboxymuconolactone decarboxylase